MSSIVHGSTIWNPPVRVYSSKQATGLYEYIVKVEVGSQIIRQWLPYTGLYLHCFITFIVWMLIKTPSVVDRFSVIFNVKNLDISPDISPLLDYKDVHFFTYLFHYSFNILYDWRNTVPCVLLLVGIWLGGLRFVYGTVKQEKLLAVSGVGVQLESTKFNGHQTFTFISYQNIEVRHIHDIRFLLLFCNTIFYSLFLILYIYFKQNSLF